MTSLGERPSDKELRLVAFFLPVFDEKASKDKVFSGAAYVPASIDLELEWERYMVDTAQVDHTERFPSREGDIYSGNFYQRLGELGAKNALKAESIIRKRPQRALLRLNAEYFELRRNFT